MSSKREMEQLYNQTKLILKHHREREKLLGTNFNIFSILGMERKETTAHSPFLAELLNPYGSHLKGPAFLELFLQSISESFIDTATAKVTMELDIGLRDDANKMGGRVDIVITDEAGNCLLIEIKIDAGDQHLQIERYCNYKKGKSKVYYLTLFGSEPEKESCGNLIAGKDYFLLSYQSDILSWLHLCRKEAADSPILRESITQYILLLKKLTSTMDTKEEKELIDLMLYHYDESIYIARNFDKALQTIGENVRQKVLARLKGTLGPEYIICEGNPTSKVYSQIWVKPAAVPDSPLYFGIESFSGLGNFSGQLFIGIFHNGGGNKSEFASQGGNTSISSYWINTYKLKDCDKVKINMSNKDTIFKLYKEADFIDTLADHIVSEVTTYISRQVNSLIHFLKQQP